MIFGPSYDDEHHCFWTFDLVNLTFVHVLVCPRREVKRFVDLTVDETSDLWITAKKVGGCLESYLKASSLTFTIQVRFDVFFFKIILFPPYISALYALYAFFLIKFWLYYT